MSDRTFTIHTRYRRGPGGWRGQCLASLARQPSNRSGLNLACRAASPPSTGGPRRSGFLALLRAAWRRHQTRRCLAELDAAALKDIGISYAQAEAEANKPFWIA